MGVVFWLFFSVVLGLLSRAVFFFSSGVLHNHPEGNRVIHHLLRRMCGPSASSVYTTRAYGLPVGSIFSSSLEYTFLCQITSPADWIARSPEHEDEEEARTNQRQQRQQLQTAATAAKLGEQGTASVFDPMFGPFSRATSIAIADADEEEERSLRPYGGRFVREGQNSGAPLGHKGILHRAKGHGKYRRQR